MKYTGRPPKYDNPEEMQKLIVKYFNECSAEGKNPTVSFTFLIVKIKLNCGLR